MRRSMSSRLLFSSPSYPDLENPPDRPWMKKKRFHSFSLLRVPLPTLTMWHSLLLLLLLLLLCYFIGLTIVAILFLAYFLFKTASRTNLWFFPMKKRSIFLDVDELSVAKKLRIKGGLGVELLGNGTVYAGEFKRGSRTGRGVIEVPDKGTYGGDWVKGAYDGYGIEDLEGDGVYTGEFVQGVRNGYGMMHFSNGDRYKGRWMHGHRNGMGEQIGADGTSYAGQYKRDMRHGLGVYHLSNGDVYLGEFFGDKRVGFGVLKYSGGGVYEGSWHEDQMNGYGIYSKRDNAKLSGKWTDGALTDAMPPSDPCVQSKVESARACAERSRGLQRVEDQVSNAVANARNAYIAAKLASANAHLIQSEFHPFDPRALAARVSINPSFQALRRNLVKFWGSTANFARH